VTHPGRERNERRHSGQARESGQPRTVRDRGRTAYAACYHRDQDESRHRHDELRPVRGRRRSVDAGVPGQRDGGDRDDQAEQRIPEPTRARRRSGHDRQRSEHPRQPRPPGGRLAGFRHQCLQPHPVLVGQQRTNALNEPQQRTRQEIRHPGAHAAGAGSGPGLVTSRRAPGGRGVDAGSNPRWCAASTPAAVNR
jgi:hypothetical protein